MWWKGMGFLIYITTIKFNYDFYDINFDCHESLKKKEHQPEIIVLVIWKKLRPRLPWRPAGSGNSLLRATIWKIIS